MALTVLVRSAEGKSAPRITFDAPRVVIGRGEGCEVRLPDPSVSLRHASIRQRGADYIVMDEGSTNGTFAGPVKLSPQAPRLIKSGDLIRVGRVWLEVKIEQALPTENGPVATRELALALVANALASDGQAAALRVTVAEGPSAGKELVLDAFDRVYVVGRGKTADLDLEDSDLSRRHVEVLRRADKVVVRDLGSKNGSAIGESKLVPNSETPWPRGVPLRIGACRLVFDDPVGMALEELETAADERMPASELIEPPKSQAPPPPESQTAAPTSGGTRGAPIAVKPRRSDPPDSGGWTATDVLVAFLAITVLVLSIVGLVWLMKSG